MANYNKIEKRFLNWNLRDEVEFRNLPEDEIDMWIEFLCNTINADLVSITVVIIHIKNGMRGITEKDFAGMVKAASLGKFRLPQKPILSSRLLGEMWSEYVLLERGGKVGMQIEEDKQGLTEIERTLIHTYYKANSLFNHFDTYKERSNYSEWKTETGFELAVKIGLVQMTNEELLEEFETVRNQWIEDHKNIEGFNPESGAYKEYQEIKDDMFLCLERKEKNKNEYYREISQKVRERVVKIALESFKDSTDKLRTRVLNKIDGLCRQKAGFPLADLIKKVNEL